MPSPSISLTTPAVGGGSDGRRTPEGSKETTTQRTPLTADFDPLRPWLFL